MTAAEWAAICEQMVALWPHYDWGRAAEANSIPAWGDELAEFEAEAVATAVKSLSREGREFPPNGGIIRKRVVELSTDVPAWGEVWDRLWRAAQMFGRSRESEAIAWLEDWSPLAAAFAKRLPFREFCTTEEPEVFHGQARRIWEQSVRRFERDAALTGLPSAGLRAVERVNREPARFGDVLKRVAELAPAAETKDAA